MGKPFSPACERNREPILGQLNWLLAKHHRVLEIGSGTGQHAVHFGQHLPHLLWQTSDLPDNHPAIHAWLDEARLANVLPPLTLDMANAGWADRAGVPAGGGFDAVYSANTAHIMSWPQVQTMLAGVAALLPPDGVFVLYGPFIVAGEPIGEGNLRFDAALRADAPHRGLRELDVMRDAAANRGLLLDTVILMPADNRLLVFIRQAAPG